MSGHLHFVVPGALATRTGGYGYDRKIIEGLRNFGWTVDVAELGGAFPNPDEKSLLKAERCFANIPDGARVVVDGLAFGVLSKIAEKERTRLRLAVLVHHPLADETGLSDDRRQQLAQSENTALGFAHIIIVTSAFTCRRLLKLGIDERKISIVEPGVVPAPPRIGGSGKRPRTPMQFLCPASYIARKGHADLLRALSGLIDLPWKLICVGSTELDRSCFSESCELRKALGLVARVELREEVRDSELNALYGASDLVVLASHYEGFGMVVTEAIARGLPVITTTGGALADTLPRGAGLAGAPGDIEALRENLRKVLIDKNIYKDLAHGAGAARETLRNWEIASRSFADALKR